MSGKSTGFWSFALTMVLVFGLVTPFARAADDPTSGSENDSKDTGASSILQSPIEPRSDKFTFSYYGVYQGPALSHLSSGGSIDTTSGEFTEGEQNLANQFKLDYNITPNVYAGPVVNFQLNPFGGAGVFMLDSGVRIGDKQLIHTANFNLLADFRVTAGMKPAYTANDEILDLQTLQIFTYLVPKTKVTVGLLCFHYYQIYGSGIPTRDPHNPLDPRDFNLYFAPNVSYQFTPTLAGVVYFEFYPWHKTGDSWDNWSNDPSDIAPGISWDITPNVNLTPQLLFYEGKPDFAHMGSIAYLSAKLF